MKPLKTKNETNDDATLKRVTINEVRAIPGFEHLSDEAATDVCQDILDLALIMDASSKMK